MPYAIFPFFNETTAIPQASRPLKNVCLIMKELKCPACLMLDYSFSSLARRSCFGLGSLDMDSLVTASVGVLYSGASPRKHGCSETGRK